MTEEREWTTNEMLTWQRSAFHFQPLMNWMNDPAGPLFYKGWYHLFYQYNPHGPLWGNMSWGHAVSRDLINWKHLPIALIRDESYDIEGVWTGSATILPDGKIYLIYTGITKESEQVQNVAYPADPSDPLLTHWVKYSGNPVIIRPTGILPTWFRDPSTAWLTPEGKWRITIGSKRDSTGVSFVYDTEDFKNYKLLDGYLHTTEGTGMWECVELYPVSKEGLNGLDTSEYGPGVKHVLKVSLIERFLDYYSIGNYDTKTNKWIPDDSARDIGSKASRIDYGQFYASKSFYDPHKKRRVMFSWIKETDSQEADEMKGWSSLQGIPRTISFDTKTGSNILQWPIDEVESLRFNPQHLEKRVEAGSKVPIDVNSADQLDIIAEFEIDKEALARVSGSNTVYDCNKSGGADERAALGPFGLYVLAHRDQTEYTAVYFYVAKDVDGNFKTFICHDQSRSSELTDVDKGNYGNIVPVLESEKLSLRILVDHSIVETFAQGGRTCITSRIYPKKAINGEAKVFLFNNATEARITVSLKIWQMKNAVIQNYADSQPANT